MRRSRAWHIAFSVEGRAGSSLTGQPVSTFRPFLTVYHFDFGS
eukprot:COSAG06_NODE_54375_length_295_cov_0.433673_1_plen_42_part_01